MLEIGLDEKWNALFARQDVKSLLVEIDRVIEKKEEKAEILPVKAQRFRAFKETRFDDIKVVILGQDPYHGDNQADGLAFSVNENMKIPPSLRNIFKEIERDLGIPCRSGGDLTRWAVQGVLLLNTVLTVEKGKAGSHRNIGWETFTDRIISSISAMTNGVVFMLWGNDSLRKMPLIDNQKHLILTSVHPSPLSAYRGFAGCGHFSAANAFLNAAGRSVINW